MATARKRSPGAERIIEALLPSHCGRYRVFVALANEIEASPAEELEAILEEGEQIWK